MGRHIASAAMGSGLVQVLAKVPHTYKLGTAALIGGGAATVYGTQQAPNSEDMETSQIAWVQELANKEGMREVLVPGQMLRKHPIGQLISEDDHMVSTIKQVDNSGRACIGPEAVCQTRRQQQVVSSTSEGHCCAQLQQCIQLCFDERGTVHNFSSAYSYALTNAVLCTVSAVHTAML